MPLGGVVVSTWLWSSTAIAAVRDPAAGDRRTLARRSRRRGGRVAVDLAVLQRQSSAGPSSHRCRCRSRCRRRSATCCRRPGCDRAVTDPSRFWMPPPPPFGAALPFTWLWSSVQHAARYPRSRGSRRSRSRRRRTPGRCCRSPGLWSSFTVPSTFDDPAPAHPPSPSRPSVCWLSLTQLLRTVSVARRSTAIEGGAGDAAARQRRAVAGHLAVIQRHRCRRCSRSRRRSPRPIRR